MSKLLSPFTLGSLELSNRVIMSAMTRGRAGTSRIPNDLMKTYYQQRASAGLIIAEATAVSEQGYGWYGAPGCYTKDHSQAWKKIVDGVHQRNGKIFLQLWHMGRQSHPSYHETNEIVAPSAVKCQAEWRLRDASKVYCDFAVPRALLTSEIPSIIDDFGRSANLAKEAGFDGVEIQGANGYLIDTFLQSRTNHRTDQYGTTLKNRSRLLMEIISEVSSVYPLDRIGVKLSPNGTFGDMGSFDNDIIFEYLAEQLKGVGYLHVMSGFRSPFHQKCRPLTLFDFKHWFGGPIIGNVGYTRDMAEGAVGTGCVDAISFGTKYLSNPDLVERFMHDLPLNPDAPRDCWYDTDGGAKGYTDFPSSTTPLFCKR